MQISSVVLQTLRPPTTPHQMENVNYLTVETQASWSLRTDSVDPCDTTLLPHHQPVRGQRTRWSPTLQPHTPTLQSGSAALILCGCMDYSLPGSSLSMGFPRQKHWSALPFPSPGDLPDPGIELWSPALADRLFPTTPPGKPPGF